MATLTITSSSFGGIGAVVQGDVPATLTIDIGVPGAQGPAGATGATGPQGPQGDPGPAGQGVPSGGLEGQILAKASDTSYDTAWQDNYATELRIVARNETGATLAKGTVVYINGAAGNKPTLAKALATGDATSAQTLGMVSDDIPNNQNGEVTVRGLLAGLDTSAFAAGTQLYLSGTTAGAVTSTKPSAPVHLVYVGIVSRQHVNQGQVEVAVQNGFELHELHDVKITSVSNGQVLKYDSAQGLWVNGTDSAPVTSVAGKTGAVTLTNSDISGLGTMATATASDYSTTTVANGLYYPLSSNPAGYLTTSAAASTYAPLAGATFTGLVATPASSTSSAGFRLPHGTAPTTPVNGDMYTTTSALFVRINSTTQQVPFLGNNNAFTSSSGSYSTGTGTGTVNLASGSTLSGNTKSVNIGTAGQAGSTTAIIVGSAAGASTTTLQGTTNGVTVAADTNSTALATTAYVVGQAGSATPLVNGTAAVGTSLRYSRQDHVHPSDTSRAPLASPALTGTPTAPTASAGTNTTQIATTAFVQTSNPAASTTTAGHVELATDSESKTGTSTTLASTPYRTNLQIINPAALEWATYNSSTSGAGAANVLYGSLVYEQDGPNASVAGYTTLHSNTQMQWVNGGSSNRLTFNKPVWISGKILKAGGFAGDANNSFRAYVGQTDTGGNPNGGDPAGAAIGVKFTGGASQVFQLMVHDGTTLRTVNGATVISTDVVYEWMVHSDGSGNAKLFINGTEEATSANAPTGTSNTTYLVQAINQTASAASRLILINRNTKVIVGT